MSKASKLEKSAISMKKVENESYIQFCNIEFVKLNEIFMKPIVTILVTRSGKIEYEGIFNTILKSNQPSLQYQLLINTGEPYFIL